ncbi:hypothetical protein NC652_033527 [Populus alba x Populus x berolinensis]|uniref:Uncharacterized protein n=1 Tax=Populus alba x Populus x berolinensis TaxID=444605 RepID=A0AAD6Q0C7_9ROSI|nr:hypothetical protein NC652_033527 [Populus alba x Populus x berolinensis]KAJ6973145.1 hypothetical protein NC653_033467 [Populus alba x Populus x berolinensis]
MPTETTLSGNAKDKDVCQQQEQELNVDPTQSARGISIYSTDASCYSTWTLMVLMMVLSV